MKRFRASAKVQRDEDWEHRDAIRPLIEYFNTSDPQKLFDFVEAIFYIISDYQEKHPEKVLGGDDIPEIFEGTLEPLLLHYERDNALLLQELHNFLPGLIDYLSKEVEKYLEGSDQCFLRELEQKFIEEAERKLEIYFIDNGYVVNREVRRNIKETAQMLVMSYFRRVLDFVLLLKVMIETKLSEQVVKRNEDNFRHGFSRGIEHGSDIRKMYHISRAAAMSRRNAFVVPRAVTPRSVTSVPAAVRPTWRQRLKNHWKRFKDSWKALSLKQKILTGIFIGLEIVAIVICATLIPYSVLVTIPGGIAITTTTVISASGSIVVSGTATLTAHEIYTLMTAPERVVSNSVAPSKQDEAVISLCQGDDATSKVVTVAAGDVRVSNNQSSLFHASQAAAAAGAGRGDDDAPVIRTSRP